MKNVSILHLYYDLMNLYGEYGNIIALRDAISSQGTKVSIDKKTIGDEIDFSKYDIVYIGAGSEYNQEIVRQDIKRFKNDISNYIDQDKVFIATGNSYELFGNKIDDKECLKIFDFNTTYKKVLTDVGERITSELIYETEIIGSPIIGFTNRNSVNDNIEAPFFKVVKGIGNDLKEKEEGILYKSFYGTYALGPLLIRNPYLLDYILSNMYDKNNATYKDKETTDKVAYEEYLKNYNIN